MERGKGQGAGDLPRGTAHPAAGCDSAGAGFGSAALPAASCRPGIGGARGRGKGQGTCLGATVTPARLCGRRRLRRVARQYPRATSLARFCLLQAGNRRGEGSGHCSLPRRGATLRAPGGSANTPWPRPLPLAPCPAFASCRPGIGGARLKGQGTCLGALLTPRRGATLRAQGSAPPRCLPIPHGRVTCPLPPAPPLLPAGRE
jgi:hypothetical protein